MADVLPDSRLLDPKGCVIADWPLGDGTGRVIRLELEPIYCFNCGKANGYVPRDVTSACSWLCGPCAETWGFTAAAHELSDRAFWRKVQEAMLDIYGRALTVAELDALAVQGELGQLALLERESPYRRMMR